MKNLKYFVIAISVFLLLGFSTSAQASELYGLAQLVGGIDGGGGVNVAAERPQTVFYSIDPNTGIPTMIGETGFDICTSLDFEPVTNRAFAVCNRIIEGNGEGPIEEAVILENRMENVGQVLVELDMTTGQGTEIGPLGVFLNDIGVSDISFRPDGALFGIIGISVEPGDNDEATKALEFEENTLIRIDTNTGEASVVGPTNTGASIDAIGFSLSGSLYHATDNVLDPGTINMLDHNTGEGTNLGNLDYPEGFDGENVLNYITSLDYDTSKNQLFGMLLSRVFEDRGVAEELESKVEFAEGAFLFRLDPDSGAIELIGMTAPFGNQFIAMAFLNRNLVSEVPTLSEYGLIATAVFFLGASVLFLRRRQAKLEI